MIASVGYIFFTTHKFKSAQSVLIEPSLLPNFIHFRSGVTDTK